MRLGYIDSFKNIDAALPMMPVLNSREHAPSHGDLSVAVLIDAHQKYAHGTFNWDQTGFISLPDRKDILYYLLRGIDQLVTQQVKVICLPLGFRTANPLLVAIAEVCYRNDILLIAPSGNSGPHKIMYPGAHPNVLCVGAVDTLGRVAAYSGSMQDENGACLKPEVLAEGTYIKDFGQIINGTSVACARVAALAVALMEISPGLSANDLKRLICQNSQPLAGSRYGLIEGFDILQSSEVVPDTEEEYTTPAQLKFKRGWIDWHLKGQCSRAKKLGRNLKGLLSFVNETPSEDLLQGMADPSACAYESFNQFNVVHINAPAVFFEKLFEHPDLLWASAVEVNYFDLASV